MRVPRRAPHQAVAQTGLILRWVRDRWDSSSPPVCLMASDTSSAWQRASAPRSAASNHLRGCPVPCRGYSHFSSSRLPRLGMNIYVGVLINNQPVSTADANYANIIPCKVKFVIPSFCYPVRCLSWSDMQLVLSCVILLKCVISVTIVKSTCRFPG